MTQVLLKELSNPDLDWLLAAGCPTTVSPQTLLWQAEQPLDICYLLLEGSLTYLLGADPNYPVTGRELLRLTAGDLAGAIPGLGVHAIGMAARTLTHCALLAIDQTVLSDKLADDPSFAAHLYRASAQLLSEQLQQLTVQLGGDTALLYQPQLRQGLTVFAELQDPDLDWLIAVGQVQPLAAHQVLIHSNRPVDAFHILLDGSVALSLPTDRSLPQLSRSLPPAAMAATEIGRLSRGEMVGETLFLEVDRPNLTVRALRDSQVLSIPRWRLAAKLLHDVGFASRFYRVLTILLANQRQLLLQQITQRLSGEALPETDLGGQFLAQVALAEARFEWMLNRLQTQQGTGREMQW